MGRAKCLKRYIHFSPTLVSIPGKVPLHILATWDRRRSGHYSRSWARARYALRAHTRCGCRCNCRQTRPIARSAHGCIGEEGQQRLKEWRQVPVKGESTSWRGGKKGWMGGARWEARNVLYCVGREKKGRKEKRKEGKKKD